MMLQELLLLKLLLTLTQYSEIQNAAAQTNSSGKLWYMIDQEVYVS